MNVKLQRSILESDYLTGLCDHPPITIDIFAAITRASGGRKVNLKPGGSYRFSAASLMVLIVFLAASLSIVAWFGRIFKNH